MGTWRPGTPSFSGLTLNLVDQIDLGQKVLTTAGALEPHGIEHLLFGRFGNAAAIEVDALLGLIALELLELTLIEAPLISDQLSTVHATDRNDHGALVSY